MKKELTTITRSFSLKVNLGNYESADFFACQSAEVEVDIAEETSEQLYEFVKKEVVKSRNEFMKERNNPQPNDSEYGQLPITAEPSGTGTFPKVYQAKPTDPWRGDNSAKYRAKDKEGTKELIIKEDLVPK